MNMGLVKSSLESAEERWALLAELMGKSEQDFDGASVSGLAPSVQSAATSFLDAWRRYAQESQDIATGMGGAVRATLADTGGVDEETEQVFTDLDTRLGPER